MRASPDRVAPSLACTMHASPCRVALALLFALACGACPPGAPAPEPGTDPTEDSGGPTWVKSFGIAGADFSPRALAAGPDGSTYQIGLSTSADTPSATQALVIARVDAGGDPVWARSYGGASVSSALETVVDVTDATDGAIWVAGHAADGACVLKVGPDGGVVQRIPLPAPARLSAIGATLDGGFVLAGVTEAGTSAQRRLGGGDLWVATFDPSGRSRWVAGLPGNEVAAEDVRAMIVDPNGEVTLCGEQNTGSVSPNFWVARFTNVGELRFTDRFSGALTRGSCRDVLTMPRLDSAVAERDAVLAVGSSMGRGLDGGQLDDPQLVYWDLAPDGGELLQDEDLDVDADTSAITNTFNAIVPLTPDSVLASGTRGIEIQCDGGASGCVWTEGFLAELTRLYDPQVGRVRFVVSRVEGPAALGLPPRTQYGDVHRATDGATYLLASEPPSSGTMTLYRLTSTDTGWSASRVAPLPSGSKIHLRRDGGFIAFTTNGLQRYDADGAQRWTTTFSRGAALSRLPVAAAPLSGGRVLVAMASPAGSVLLAFDGDGTLYAQRLYPDLTITGLAALDGGSGRGGDRALAIAASNTTGLMRLELDRDAVALTRTDLEDATATGPISAAGARLAIPTTRGLWFVESTGGPLWDFHAARATALLPTPEGGAWQVVRRYDGSTRAVRYAPDASVLVDRSFRFAAGADLVDAPTVALVDEAAVRGDGGLVLLGSVVFPAPGPGIELVCSQPYTCGDVLVASLDAQGETTWARVYGTARTERPVETPDVHDLAPRILGSRDLGLVALADTNGYATPRWTTFGLRLDADGHASPGCVAERPASLSTPEAPALGGGVQPPPRITSYVPREQPLPASQAVRGEATAVELITARSCAGNSAAPSLLFTVSGRGRVTSSPAGIDCPGDCDQAWPTGTAVTVSALADEGFHLAAWEGDCASFGVAPSFTLTLTAKKTCKARFASGPPIYVADDSNDPDAEVIQRDTLDPDLRDTAPEDTGLEEDTARDGDPGPDAQDAPDASDGIDSTDATDTSVPPDACQPTCVPNTCGGSDGCGGTCGCDPDEACVQSVCVGPPAAPTLTVTEPTTGTLRAAWTPVATATTYRLYLGFDLALTPTDGRRIYEGPGPFELANLAPGLAASLVVTAVNAAGEGPASNVVTRTPSPRPDGVPPALRCASPHDRATSIAVTDPIILTFDEPLDPTSPGASVTLSTTNPSAAVPGTLTFAGGTVTFTPTAPLAPSTRYTVAVTAQLRDQSGNPAAPRTHTFTTRPAAPTGLAIAAGPTALTLTWTAVPAARGYTVHVVYPGSNGETLLAGTSRPVVTAPYAPGTSFRVRVTTADGTSDPATIAAPASAPAAPVPPNTIQLVPGNGAITVAWADNSGDPATTWDLLRTTSADGAYTLIASNLTTTTYRDVAVVNGTTYRYVLQPRLAGVPGPYSVENSATPLATLLPAPTGLAQTSGSRWVNLTWSAVAGAQGYAVYATTDPRQPAAIVLRATTTSALIPVNDDQPTTLSVATLGRDGTPGARSPTLTVTTTGLGAPRSVTGLRAFSPAAGAVRVDWAPALGATGYEVTRTPAFDAPVIVYGPSYSDMPSGSATYRVQALSSGGTAAAISSPVQATADANIDAPPGGLGAVTNATCTTLSWSRVIGAYWYHIERRDPVSGEFVQVGGGTYDGRDTAQTVCDLTGPTELRVFTYRLTGLSTNASGLTVTPDPLRPERPAAPVLIPGRDRVELQWPAAPSATRYHLFKRTESTAWSELAATTLPGYTDTAVQDGVLTYYALQLENAAGRGPWSPYAQTSVSAAYPVPPTEVVGVAGDGCVSLGWPAQPDASWYYVRSSTSRGGPYEPIHGGTDFTFDNRATLCGLTNDETRWYVVQTYAPTGVSAFSSELALTPRAALPPAPSIAAVEVGDGAIDLGWAPVPGAIGYHVVRQSLTSSWSEVAAVTGTTFRDPLAGNGTSYRYALAVDFAPPAPGGDAIIGPLGPATGFVIPSADHLRAPTNVALQPGRDCVTLSFDAVPGASWWSVLQAPTADSARTYLSYTNDPWDTLWTTCEGPSTPLPPWLWVQTVASQGSSLAVGALPAMLSPALPAVPTGLAATAGSGAVDLGWAAVPTATAYHVFRRTPTSAWEDLGATPHPAYFDGCLGDATYSYRVQAENAAGRGAVSTELVSAQPDPTRPRAPTAVSADAGPECLSFAWDAVPGASWYVLSAGPTPAGPWTLVAASNDAFDTRARTCVASPMPYFAVQTYASTGTSTHSPAVAASPDSTRPASPAATVTLTAPGTLTVTWPDDPQAAGYRVHRRTASSPWVLVAETAAATFVDANLPIGVTHTYAVQAFNAAGPGDVGPPSGALAP